MFAMEQQQNQSPRHQRSRETPEKTASKKRNTKNTEKQRKKTKNRKETCLSGGGRHGISPVSPTSLGELGD
jgi:hypothetical protein